MIEVCDRPLAFFMSTWIESNNRGLELIECFVVVGIFRQGLPKICCIHVDIPTRMELLVCYRRNVGARKLKLEIVEVKLEFARFGRVETQRVTIPSCWHRRCSRHSRRKCRGCRDCWSIDSWWC